MVPEGSRRTNHSACFRSALPPSRISFSRSLKALVSPNVVSLETKTSLCVLVVVVGIEGASTHPENSTASLCPAAHLWLQEATGALHTQTAAHCGALAGLELTT